MNLDLHDLRRREVQELGAALSCRNWHMMETAYNSLRDKLDNAGFHVGATATAEAASGAGERDVARRDVAAWVNSIKGVRPADQFIALDRRLFEDCITRALSSCLPADPDGRKLVPVGDPVPLNECPPGPFEFEGSLGFRSEYSTTLELPRRYQVDAYTFESGEYFWGGAKGTEARGKLIVQPLALGEQRRRAAA